MKFIRIGLKLLNKFQLIRPTKSNNRNHQRFSTAHFRIYHKKAFFDPFAHVAVKKQPETKFSISTYFVCVMLLHVKVFYVIQI